jgi:hypothetical protein
MKKVVVVGMIFWVLSGIFASGLWNARDQVLVGRWSGSRTQITLVSESLVLGALLGPFAMIAALATTGFGADGWSLKTYDATNR